MSQENKLRANVLTIIEDMKRVRKDQHSRTWEDIDFLINCWIDCLEYGVEN